MSKASKIIVTIVAVLIFIILHVIVTSTSATGRPGILGLILAFALFGALCAVWKKPKNKQ